VSKEGWLELAKASGEVADLPIYGDDRGTLKIDQLLSSARLFIRRHGVELVVVDYLQIVSAPGRDTSLGLNAMWSRVGVRTQSQRYSLGTWSCG
jgi:replicative DNA helicase